MDDRKTTPPLSGNYRGLLERVRTVGSEEKAEDYLEIPGWDGHVSTTTDKAALLRFPAHGSGSRELWFPLSTLRIKPDGRIVCLWLTLKSKGLPKATFSTSSADPSSAMSALREILEDAAKLPVDFDPEIRCTPRRRPTPHGDIETVKFEFEVPLLTAEDIGRLWKGPRRGQGAAHRKKQDRTA